MVVFYIRKLVFVISVLSFTFLAGFSCKKTSLTKDDADDGNSISSSSTPGSGSSDSDDPADVENSGSGGSSGSGSGSGGSGTSGGSGGGGNLSSPTNLDDGVRGNSLTDSPNISWDSVLGAVSYEVAIGSSAGDTDVLGWTDIGSSTAHLANSLTLTSGNIYYASVRAVDGSGNKGDIAQGDGWHNLSCPSGYIKVHGNTTSGLGGSIYTEGTKSLYDWDNDPTTATSRNISDFCVMKYEAKDSGSGTWSLRAISAAADTPWTSIPRELGGTNDDAQEACEAIGADYYLIGNHHWQAIARDIETVASNYDTSGPVADYKYNRGHTDGSGSLAADSDDDNACANIGSDTHDASPVAANCGAVWHLNKRTHALSNGEVIWDFSGNVWEWVFDLNSTSQGSSGNVQAEVYSDALKWGSSGDYSSQTGIHKAGLGFFSDGTLGGVFRGSLYNNATVGGLYSTNLLNAVTQSNGFIGFRCVYAP